VNYSNLRIELISPRQARLRRTEKN